MKYLLVLALVFGCASSVKHKDKDKEVEVSAGIDPITVEAKPVDLPAEEDKHKDKNKDEDLGRRCQRRLNQKDKELVRCEKDLEAYKDAQDEGYHWR